ncbi:hypothetical protein IAU59_001193 [Kwoniella sp. CBS 9459]
MLSSDANENAVRPFGDDSHQSNLAKLDITTLEPLLPVQYLIFAELKELVPLTMLRVSRSLYEELLPAIYTSIRLSEKNIDHFLQGWKLNEAPAAKGKKTRGMYTKTLEFADEETAFQWTWFVDYKLIDKADALELEEDARPSSDHESSLEDIQWDSKEMWFPNLETFVYGSSLVQSFVPQPLDRSESRPEQQNLIFFGDNVMNAFAPRTIVVQAPSSTVGWPDSISFRNMIAFDGTSRDYPARTIVIQLPPALLTFPLDVDHTAYVNCGVALLWMTYRWKARFLRRYIIRGPQDLKTPVKDWIVDRLRAPHPLKREFARRLNIVDVEQG